MSVWVLLGFATKSWCANIHCLFLLNTRIDANVEDTQLNVEMAHTEILKYFQSVSSNRWLMIKIFLVLIIFFIIFVVFLAWEGTTLSVRRDENGANGFEGVRNRLWTYGRMCKNTSGLCRRGLWLPGGGFGGVLMLSGGMIFVRVTWVRC